MKWVLVIAGVKDMSRPVERVSLPQSAALATTGVIWARYSMVITPVNYNLGLVNLFVGATGLYQVVRVVAHEESFGEATRQQASLPRPAGQPDLDAATGRERGTHSVAIFYPKSEDPRT
eukprot:CAMPEP_0184682246 /NCGR_PEP_ID=MMETSP0312-20130426/6469_1 /TAXON_ID=31354 /ORGANISM="Compsopogon coeruleus, Strain SAG 36.94" /LENGTH=118 /DNA_ID=CAMNT_0027133783 /DNA_START=208 /DNA_END=565 /DNA_ORIENTATION=-